MVAGNTLLKAALVLCVLSWIFQVLGYTCPGWLVVAIDLSAIGANLGSGMLGFGEIVTSSAVWYASVCIKGDFISTCSSSVHHDSSFMGFRLTKALADLSDLSWVEIEVELTLALFFCSVGIFVAVLGLCEAMRLSPKVLSSMSSAMMLLSGTLVLPAVIKVGLSIQDAKTAINLISESAGYQLADVRAPWALALSTIGLILAFISCVILLIAACKQNEQTTMMITPGTGTLHPAILQIGNFPFNISNFRIFAAENGHIPAPEMNQDRLPPIGSRDDAPIEGMENVAMERETTFVPFVVYQPHFGHSNGSSCHLDEVQTTDLAPPSNDDLPPPYKENQPKKERHLMTTYHNHTRKINQKKKKVLKKNK